MLIRPVSNVQLTPPDYFRRRRRRRRRTRALP